MKVAITTSSFAQYSDKPLQMLEEKGIEAVLNPFGRALTEAETIKLLSGCVGVAAGTEPLTEKVMEAIPGLRVISRCGAGMDNVDMEAAAKRGIIVRNTPDGPTRAVAELILGYTLDMLRSISLMDRDLRAGVWKKRMGFQLQGKKLGVIGFGRIGRAVSELFRNMGCEVAFFDPFVRDSGIFTWMELEDLLPWADIITLHCPKTGDGSPILGDAQLKLMKKGAWLINAARGGLVDETSLYACINTEALAGAAIDVFGNEPYRGPLLELPSVVLTPHIGSYARESRINMEIETIKNLLEALPA